MITFNAGRILEPKDWADCICPLSMASDKVTRCEGPRCPKWVRLIDAIGLLPERQRRHLNAVYETDDEQLECGFCSL